MDFPLGRSSSATVAVSLGQGDLHHDTVVGSGHCRPVLNRGGVLVLGPPPLLARADPARADLMAMVVWGG